MHASYEVMINAPLEMVLNHYVSHESRLLWDKNLTEIKKINDEEQSYMLIYSENGEHFQMKEVMKEEDLPDFLEHHYITEGAKKIQKDLFLSYKGKSIWVMDCDFLFENFHNIPKELFEKKIKEDMLRFKGFVENSSEH